MSNSKCGCEGKAVRQLITREGCPDPCEDLQLLLPDDPSEIVSKDIETVYMITVDPVAETCGIDQVIVPEEEDPCVQIRADLPAPVQVPLEDLQALDLSDPSGCLVSIPTIPDAPELPDICDEMQNLFGGTPTAVDYTVPTLMHFDTNTGDCVPVQLNPIPTACEQLSALPVETVPVEDAIFFGEVSDGQGGTTCAKFMVECCPTQFFQSATGGGICLTIDAGNQYYNAYAEGGHGGVGAIYNEMVYTNTNPYPVHFRVYWNYTSNRYSPSQFVNSQLVAYLGPPEHAFTGSGNAAVVGTTSFSGLAEGPTNEIAYGIHELPYGLDGYGPNTIFTEHVTQHIARPGELWAYPSYENPTHHFADSLETVYYVAPRDTVTVVGTWMIRHNEPLAAPESYYLLGDMHAVATKAEEQP